MVPILEWAMVGAGALGALWSLTNRYWFLFLLSLVLVTLGLFLVV